MNNKTFVGLKFTSKNELINNQSLFQNNISNNNKSQDNISNNNKSLSQDNISNNNKSLSQDNISNNNNNFQSILENEKKYREQVYLKCDTILKEEKSLYDQMLSIILDKEKEKNKRFKVVSLKLIPLINELLNLYDSYLKENEKLALKYHSVTVNKLMERVIQNGKQYENWEFNKKN